MKTQGFIRKAVPVLVLAAAAADLPGATTPLADAPLVTAAGANVKPNLMFVLDDSGSMDFDYMPDWVAPGFPSPAYPADYLFRNAGYNSLAYNPAINYKPPVKFNADGSEDTTSYPSQTAANTSNWTNVKFDGYGAQDLSRANYHLACPNGSTTGLFCNLVLFPNFGPRYYVFQAGEYCTEKDLTVCRAQTVADATYDEPAPLRWCQTSAIATAAATPADYKCRAVRVESGGTSTGPIFQDARYPKPPLIALSFSGTSSTTLTGIAVGGVPILLAGTSLASNNPATMAGLVAGAINRNSAVTGMFASQSGSSVTVAQHDLAAGLVATVGPLTSSTGVSVIKSGGMTVTSAITINRVPGKVLRVDIVPTNNSYPYPGRAAKASTREDCAGTTCTYAEEMTNYANWWAYYHTRMQMMKTATSHAFRSIDSDFRVGYFSIDNTTGSDFLNIGDYDNAAKSAWYTKLQSAKPGLGTPLRTALTAAGRVYGAKQSTLNGGTVADPVQYSCQQNFTILSTDGYWNGSGGEQLASSTAIGNEDGAEDRPMLDGRGDANTLADVAEYYWKTDLRTTALGNCTGAPDADGVRHILCSAEDPDHYNNVPISPLDNNAKQHMTTFTLGLGASGYMQFDSEYANATRGDFYSVKTGAMANPSQGVCVWQSGGACNWPQPRSDRQSNIDDLWHASINGRGSYFNAGDPTQVVNGLTTALSGISGRLGASAAAITSNPNITVDDNLLFSTRFTTGEWTGQVVRQRLEPETGRVPTYDATRGPGTFGELDYNYDWTAQSKLDDRRWRPTDQDARGRDIYIYDASAADHREQFLYDNLDDAYKTYFEKETISQRYNTNFNPDPDAPRIEPQPLSQFCVPEGSASCLAAGSADTGRGADANLVNFLRGDSANEDTPTDTRKYYRNRQHKLGDVVDAETVYVQRPLQTYRDPGYAAFARAQANRAPRLYAAANDGMLHAFNAGAAADGGEEVWAYVPTMVLPNIYKLADKQYAGKHKFFLNGSPVVGDICTNDPPANCSAGGWRTILVGGLGHGGRGFYALDITDPDHPTVLWEFWPGTRDNPSSTPEAANVGYSYGNPIITKLAADGRWVVLVTSGYNNVPDPLNPETSFSGDGKGHLYVLDADGNGGQPDVLSDISTDVGSPTDPSGLAHINTWVDDIDYSNTALRVYGGDLKGNLWRFDINGDTGAAGYDAQLLATFTDAGGVSGSPQAQPITATPELGEINGQAVVFVGTGKFLGPLDHEDPSVQSFYAVRDPLLTDTTPSVAIYPSIRGNTCATGTVSGCFVNQVKTRVAACPPDTPPILCLPDSGPAVTSTNETVDFVRGNGWYFDLPEIGERANTDPVLLYGTLVFNTNVPGDEACSAGGHSNRYFLDYRTGGALYPETSLISGSQLGEALASRPVPMGLSNDNIATTSQLSNATNARRDEPRNNASNATRRASWRELIDNGQ